MSHAKFQDQTIAGLIANAEDIPYMFCPYEGYPTGGPMKNVNLPIAEFGKACTALRPSAPPPECFTTVEEVQADVRGVIACLEYCKSLDVSKRHQVCLGTEIDS